MSAEEWAEIQRLIQLHADACNIGMRVVAERDEARRERTEFEVEAVELRVTLAAVAALADSIDPPENEHVAGCEGQPDCSRCVALDLRAVLADHAEAEAAS